MKKIAAAAGLAALTIVAAVLSGAALANGTDGATKPSEPAAKVYICHATGSASNPYVLIYVSSHALPAHTGHQDGRDIVLGSKPGACPQPATTQSVNGQEQTQAPPPVTPQSQEPNNTAPASTANDEANESATAEENENADVSKANDEANENEAAEDNENDSAAPKAHESNDNEGSDENHSGSVDNHSSSDENHSGSDD